MSNETLDGAIPAGSGARGGPSQAQYRASGQEVGGSQGPSPLKKGLEPYDGFFRKRVIQTPLRVQS